MNKMISNLFIFTLCLHTFSSVKISDGLASDYITYELMAKKFDEGPQELDMDKPYYLDLTNLKALAAQILSGAKAIGAGQFGKVFKFPYLLSNDGSLKTMAVAKEIFFNNNYNSSEGEEEQDMIQQEIDFNKILTEYDPNGLYFPTYYGTYEVTKYFAALEKTTSNATIKKLLKGTAKQNILVLEMEYLDQEMFKYQGQIIKQATSIYFHTRCKIGESVLQGLISFYSEFSHCDIKPENLMAKSLTQAEMDRLEGFGIERIELYPGKFYQVKIIDFGLVAKGEPKKRRCIGGTPGLLPDEFFTRETHANFDVYSVAVLLLDMEMAVLGYDYFSHMQDFFVTCKRDNRGLSNKEKGQLETITFYRMAVLYGKSKNPHFTKFMAKIRENIPNIDSIISKNFSMQKLEEVDVAKYVFGNPNIMRKVLLSAFEIYLENDFISTKVKKLIDEANKQFNQESAKLQGMDNSSEAFKKLMETIKFWSNEKEIIEVTGTYQLELMKYCLEQIKASAAERVGLQAFLEKLQGLRTVFTETLGDKLNYNLKYKRYYHIESAPGRRITREDSMVSYEETEQQKRPSFRLDDRYLIRI